MMNKFIRRTLILSTAFSLTLGGLAGGAQAAYDDMDAVSLAKKMVGKEYTKGAESLSRGFDSSGLVYYIFEELGYNMPRSLNDQYTMNKTKITKTSSLVAGDVLFFGSKNDPDYTGIYIGSGKFVMASKGKDEVVTRTLSDFSEEFIGARRILSADDRLRVELVLDARKYLGTPYVFGAKYGQTKTFDCSSFVKTIFAQNGMTLSRVSYNQAKEGKYVKKSDLKVGDLVFFTTPSSGKRIGHVGMYVGNGQMIHTFGEGGVKYESISKDWWADHYVTARTIIGN